MLHTKLAATVMRDVYLKRELIKEKIEILAHEIFWLYSIYLRFFQVFLLQPRAPVS